MEMIEPRVLIDSDNGHYIMCHPDMKGGPIVSAPTYWGCYEKYKEAYKYSLVVKAMIEYEKIQKN